MAKAGKSRSSATTADPSVEPEAAGEGDSNGSNGSNGGGNGPTAAQIRRFIRSRSYMPLHEIRRRFNVGGDEDGVSPVDVGEGRTLYVGLPAKEAALLGELIRAGDCSFELLLDPVAPLIIGVFPTKPVPRT